MSLRLTSFLFILFFSFSVLAEDEKKDENLLENFVYFKLEPSSTITFILEDGTFSYLTLDIALLLSSSEDLTVVLKYEQVFRATLNNIFLNYGPVKSTNSYYRETLQNELKEAFNDVIVNHSSSNGKEYVKRVLFTRFIYR